MRKAYPDAKITFLTTLRCQDIVKGYKGINKVILFDRYGKDEGFLNRLRFTVNLRKEKFDLVIVLKGSLNYIFLSANKIWRPKSDVNFTHPVDRYIAMLRFHGLNIEKVSFNFTLEDDNVSFCKDFFRSKNIQLKDTLIGILPLAGWSLKSWPIEKWNRLADILKRRWKIRTISLGKLPDNELGRRIASELSDNIISADNTTLSQAKALLRYCKAFIGPDSSFLHLGSCMGVETVGLYGPTSNNRFYPYFHQHNIISSKNKLECMPCYPGNKPSCNTKEVKHDFGLCMQRIKVEDVVSLVKKRLNLK